MPPIIRERPHRLTEDLYCGFVTVSFTCCIKNHIQVFNRQEIFAEFSSVLFQEASSHFCTVPAYIFMPNHCHILLQGTAENANTIRAIRLFKQRTGYWFSQHLQDVHWQKDFYDHILRPNDDIDKHIRYILDNPIRKGIIDDWKMYPWKGSSVGDINEWEG